MIAPLENLLDTPVAQMADLPSDALAEAKIHAAEFLALAKSMVEHIDRALGLKYADRAHQLRLAAGRDTGVVHFDDGRVRISAELAKKVEWDQTKLADLVRRIAANGEDPAQYVEISYRVSESKFTSWPDTLKGACAPASRRSGWPCSTAKEPDHGTSHHLCR